MLIVKLKTFEEIASVSVPTIMQCHYNKCTFDAICLENLKFKNFNSPDGKYKFIPHLMLPLMDSELVVSTDDYEDCYYYNKDGAHVKLGRWMVNIIGKYDDTQH